MRPVAVGNLPAVDREVEGSLLSDLNVIHVGQLAALPRSKLTDAFGKKGPVLHREARGVDNTPVRPPRRSPVVEEVMPAFPEDTNDDAVLLGALRVLVERGCRRLRRAGWVAGRAELSVRYSDGMPAVRRTELKPPLTRDWALFQKLRPVFEAAVARRGRVRSMTLRLGRRRPRCFSLRR